MNLAILSTNNLPRFLGQEHPSEEALFAEDNLLIRELAMLGLAAERVPWRQKNVSWRKFDLVLIRSTWDYIDDLPSFLNTLREIQASGVRLVNPFETVKWNYDKRYLQELIARDLRVVPTHFVDRGSQHKEQISCWSTEYSRFVVKPVVGLGAFGVKVFSNADELIQELETDNGSEILMIQPFLPSVPSEGEWSFVFGAGDFLYAALKTPAAGDFRVQVVYGATTMLRTPTQPDLDAAREIFEALPVPANLARIDMARLPDGQLALMEAELIEPQLYLFDIPQAAAKLANAIHHIAHN